MGCPPVCAHARTRARARAQVPAFVSQAWGAAAGDSLDEVQEGAKLGVLRLERDPTQGEWSQDTSADAFVVLEGPTAARLPKEYIVNSSVGSAPAAVFSQLDSDDGRFGLAVEGWVERKGDLQPRDLQCKEYKALMRERLLGANKRKATVAVERSIMLNPIRNKVTRRDRKVIAGTGAWETRTRETYTEEQLRDRLFGYFQEKEAWTFKELFARFDREHGNAPHSQVREVLADICDQYRDGAKAMQYSLKPEYALGIKLPSSDQAGVGGNAAMK